MTTLENVLENKNLNWLLNNSETTFEDSECKSTYFTGKLTNKMLSDLRNWFNKNGGNRCGGTVKVQFGEKWGSVNLYTSSLPTFSTATLISFNGLPILDRPLSIIRPIGVPLVTHKR